MFQSFSVLYILVVDAYCGMYFMYLSFENWALLPKWWWRFGNEKRALWRKVTEAKYREGEVGWVPKRVSRYQVSGLRGNIVRVWSTWVGFRAGEGRCVLLA